jgi:uncharacterized membrane protein
MMFVDLILLFERRFCNKDGPQLRAREVFFLFLFISVLEIFFFCTGLFINALIFLLCLLFVFCAGKFVFILLWEKSLTYFSFLHNATVPALSGKHLFISTSNTSEPFASFLLLDTPVCEIL